MSPNPANPATGPEISKAEIRALALQHRRNLADKDRRSAAICERFRAIPQYPGAEAVLVFMHIRDEVRTTSLVAHLLQSGKKAVIPYCAGDNLELYHLTDLTELAPGVLGIPEPRASFRSLAERHVGPEELDLLAVPGVAFDTAGGRVGYGRGYFDRLLRKLRADAVSVGIAFQCQLFDRVPMESHDVPLGAVATEDALYWAR